MGISKSKSVDLSKSKSKRVSKSNDNTLISIESLGFTVMSISDVEKSRCKAKQYLFA